MKNIVTQLDIYFSENITDPEEMHSMYDMKYPRRGKAIIMNHMYFDERLRVGYRLGSDVDAKNLEITLTDLEFEVHVYNDLDFEAISQVLRSLSQEDHTDADCMVFAVLSHGDSKTLYAHDTSYLRSVLWGYFTDEKCPTLAGKPKIFFIQACQGTLLDDGIHLQSLNLNTSDIYDKITKTEDQTDASKLGQINDGSTIEKTSNKTKFEIKVQKDEQNEIETEALKLTKILQDYIKYDSPTYYISLSQEIKSNNDILVVCSTIPGFFSWRNTDKGSWFIQALCQILQKHSAKYDLLRNMTRVAHKTAISFQSNAARIDMDEKKQIPSITSKLTRDIFFEPKSRSKPFN